MEDYQTKGALLSASLAAAVPLWIEDLRGLTFEERDQIAKECSQHLAEKGDILLYRSGKKGETAKAFNMLAKGVAVLAFVPGGVKVFGNHFEAEPMAKKRAKRAAETSESSQTETDRQDSSQVSAVGAVREILLTIDELMAGPINELTVRLAADRIKSIAKGVE